MELGISSTAKWLWRGVHSLHGLHDLHDFQPRADEYFLKINRFYIGEIMQIIQVMQASPAYELRRGIAGTAPLCAIRRPNPHESEHCPLSRSVGAL